MPTASGILITPTSIAYTGTSATIGANGSVTFTACSSLSLNGVFTADYDNYMIVLRNSAGGSIALNGKLMSGGTPTSGSDYTWQYLDANSTSVTGARLSTQTTFRVTNPETLQNGVVCHIYGPYLTQPTAMRSTSAASFSGAQVFDVASTHSLSTSYDGLQIIPTSSNISGRITVYGMRQ